MPYAFQGVIFIPLLVGLIFVLKMFCPDSAGNMCFSDYFALPLFLPLVMVYRIFGLESEALGQELLFLILYWSLIGFLLGLILDLYTRPSPYSPEQRPPL